MTDDAVKDEIRSAIETRRELGEEMEPAVIEAFVERIERRLDERAGDVQALEVRLEHHKAMVLGPMAFSIPLLAIAAIFTGLPGVIAVCVALIAVAIAANRG